MRVRRASSSGSAPRPPRAGVGGAPAGGLPDGGSDAGPPRPPGLIRRRIAEHPVAADVVLALTTGAVAFISGTAKIDT